MVKDPLKNKFEIIIILAVSLLIEFYKGGIKFIATLYAGNGILSSKLSQSA